MGRTVVAIILWASVVATAPLLVGCGGSEAPFPTGRQEVPVEVTVDVAPFTIQEIALSTVWPGDRIDAAGATARIQRPDGTSDAMTLQVSADGKKLTLGQATVVPWDAGDGVSQGTVSADVRLIAEIVTAPGEITSVTLRTRDPGDTLDITGAEARVYRADSTDDVVNMTISADQTEVVLGPCALASVASWWGNYLYIDGPMVVQDGPTGSATEIGYLGLEVDVRSDGHVVIPATIRVSIPTIGTADDRRLVIEGLTPEHDQAWVAVGEQSGAWLSSKLYQADPSGQVIITDTMARVTAERLSGPDSSLWLNFTDPDAPTPPPGPPGGGGGPPVPPSPGPGGGEENDEGSRLNVVVIGGPLWVIHGKTGARTELGRIKFGFEVLGDGTVVAPEGLSLHVPASGTARESAVGVAGLEPGDFVRTRVVEDSGAATVSATYQANSEGSVSVLGALRGITALRLSGRHSSLSFWFARTDADDDGVPDCF
ncbi:MAG: hypothetical protein FJX75_14790 [Armatimonadetes bacterium]|nr:hypothetical protein [Armatimonadota bacterium]